MKPLVRQFALVPVLLSSAVVHNALNWESFLNAFLGVLAVLPSLVEGQTNIDEVSANASTECIQCSLAVLQTLAQLPDVLLGSHVFVCLEVLPLLVPLLSSLVDEYRLAALLVCADIADVYATHGHDLAASAEVGCTG